MPNSSGVSPYDAGANEAPYTDTGTGAYDGPPAEVTIKALEHEEGPTGAVPGPPKSVTTRSFPAKDDDETETETKAVKASDVEDKSVKSSSKKRA